MLFINFSYFRALTGKYPPKIRMYSKYERRTDTRTYEDRKKLYEGVSISHFHTLLVCSNVHNPLVTAIFSEILKVRNADRFFSLVINIFWVKNIRVGRL